jgi:hypothetical protein
MCQMFPNQVWSWWLAAWAAHLFSQRNVSWRSLPHTRGSGSQSFDSPMCLTSAKCGSSISARSLTHGVHTVCLCSPVATLDLPLLTLHQKSYFSEACQWHSQNKSSTERFYVQLKFPKKMEKSNLHTY